MNTFTTSSQLSLSQASCSRDFQKFIATGKFSTQHHTTISHQLSKSGCLDHMPVHPCFSRVSSTLDIQQKLDITGKLTLELKNCCSSLLQCSDVGQECSLRDMGITLMPKSVSDPFLVIPCMQQGKPPGAFHTTDAHRARSRSNKEQCRK